MVQTIEVEGFDAYKEQVEIAKAAGKKIFVLFSGSKTANGTSWCPDCVTAEPVVKGALHKAGEDDVFLYVGVGGRDFWKDPKCIFRTDGMTKLKTVPTLFIYGCMQRLEEAECANKGLCEMMFEDADY